jgi:hypothetical protein
VGTRFVDRQGLIVFLQIFFSLFMILAVYRKRHVINDSQRWRFPAERPYATGIFFGTIVFMSFYEYRGPQDTLAFYLAIVGGISFARLISALNLVPWKKQFIYGVIIVNIITRLLQVIMLPLPLMRLFTVMAPHSGQALAIWPLSSLQKSGENRGWPNFYSYLCYVRRHLCLPSCCSCT